jgi:hypothetical protein
LSYRSDACLKLLAADNLTFEARGDSSDSVAVLRRVRPHEDRHRYGIPRRGISRETL